MIRSFTECGPAITEEDVRAVEQEIGLLFPENYKDFLLTQNGGRPSPNGFPIAGHNIDDFGGIQVFLRINGDVESSNLDWTYQIMYGRLPDNLFPIARDDGGDLVCISLYGEDAGAVVFWDIHQETDEPTYDNVYHIANSFEEFIESIRELPES
jgi:cell wall assembly regulator SMI1